MPPKRGRKKTVDKEDPYGGDTEEGWQFSDAKAALKAAILDGEIPLKAAAVEDEAGVPLRWCSVAGRLAEGGVGVAAAGRLRSKW